MINPLVNLKLVTLHTKVGTSALQTFADVFVDCINVPDVLPSVQFIKRCTAKDNADVIRSLPENECFM